MGEFLTSLRIDVELPPGFSVLNPYVDSEVRRVVKEFCARYYTTNTSRLGIWGINPGRLGAGLTGLSFTDPPALRDDLKIESKIVGRRESSAEFIYKLIHAYGGVEPFYESNYLSALSPLGFVKNEVNINFYDDAAFAKRLTPSIVKWMCNQMSFGLRTDRCVVLGSGKLKNYVERKVKPTLQFERIDFLEHPRYIMQYRRVELAKYIDRYLEVLAD